ncbi:hypothetical protein P170DRAFT_473200 [Aspergillus steynii IBT 23096]|uniref:Uncharacterized protein n=1 Tax=Aspergillus steynii IBT 23096 TaxID=1392250 RepID=A0A2I2GKD4_9EURO|nr:uncharacterized protein P170DRAFT_473200 [Aspergillus steynii IBT 23096]PLB53331.1 hypothetical protein P170DRAFT_473200 [Aspergillus steynii IBT 23096]
MTGCKSDHENELGNYQSYLISYVGAVDVASTGDRNGGTGIRRTVDITQIMEMIDDQRPPPQLGCG